MEALKGFGFPKTDCINYLEPLTDREDTRTDWQHRMQNLSISCALVCLIIIGSAAFVGTFGVLKNQISAVLVTGVMYLLAATFAFFTLTIIHFKRRSSNCAGPAGDGVISVFGSKRLANKVTDYLAPGRVNTSGWSLELGWSALGLCTAASTLWILLARLMRFSPGTTILS